MGPMAEAFGALAHGYEQFRGLWHPRYEPTSIFEIVPADGCQFQEAETSVRRRFLGSSWASSGLPVIIDVRAVIKAQWCVENLILDRGGCRFVGCYLDDDGSSGGAPKKIKTLCHSKRKRVRLWRLPGFDFDLLLISSASRAASDRAQPSSPLGIIVDNENFTRIRHQFRPPQPLARNPVMRPASTWPRLCCVGSARTQEMRN